MVATIPLTRGLVCTVDDEIFPIVSQWKWHALGGRNGRFYAFRIQYEGQERIRILMHRLILGLPPGNDPRVDHIDGDSLNNQRSNLRPVTHAQNMQNRRGARAGSVTGVRGVCIDKRTGSYIAQVRVNGKGVLRKYFKTLEEADQAAQLARALYMTHSTESRTDDRVTVRGVLAGIERHGYRLVKAD